MKMDFFCSQNLTIPIPEVRPRAVPNIGGDVSGNSGPDHQSEEKFHGFASMDVLLGKYYKLQIMILTSGRSDIEKINRKKGKVQ